jgi:hypothetical protein
MYEPSDSVAAGNTSEPRTLTATHGTVAKTNIGTIGKRNGRSAPQSGAVNLDSKLRLRVAS